MMCLYLFVLPFLLLLLILTIIFAVKKMWKWATMAFFLFLITNYVTQTIPFNLTLGKDSDKADLKVLCYNVRCLNSAYPDNEIKIARQILAEDPDVIYLCEFALYRNRQLDSIMNKNSYCRYYISGTNCVFYSKYLIVSFESIIKEGMTRKHSLNAMALVDVKGTKITIIGCHLSSSHHHLLEGYNRRQKEADTIYDIITKNSYPVIVMGDMNDISGSYTIRRIQDAGLVDAWWERGCGYGTTFHNKLLKLRLDHILYQKEKINLKHVRVIDSDFSDHNALFASFTFVK